jgi:catechol 2,3-dioxygenase-like lactoylglutathione lyase family enzyme
MWSAMFDHLSLGTLDLARAARFYDAALAPLGLARVWSSPDSVGYGAPGQEDKLAIKLRPGAQAPGAGFHLALSATSRSQVDDFYARALEHGGRDDGAPGLRPRYGAGYYAAFVVDPDGHRLEMVVHEPVSKER